MIGRHNFNLVTENTQSRGGGLGKPGKNTRVGTIENYAIHIARDNGERGAAIQTRGFVVNVLIGNSGVRFRGGLFDTTNRPSYNDDVGFEEERPTGTLPQYQFPKGEDALFDDGGLW